MSRDHAIALAVQTLDSGRFATALARRVAYVTESEEPDAAAAALRAYLDEEMRPTLAGLGFTVLDIANPIDPRLPAIIAERIEDPSLPTVLLYGHGDVVRGHASQWRDGLAPYTLTDEGDRWYGRGTADNKGQHSVNLAALEAVLQAREGRLGFNVRVLLEMGEEAGSPGLREICQTHRDAVAADLFIASDGPRVAAERPTLFLGSRGAINFTLTLQRRERGYHAGNWGGALANPAIEMAHAIASLVDANGRLAVAGLRPDSVPEAVRAALRDVPLGGGANDPAVDAHWGEPGLTPIERVIGWNDLEVLAMTAGTPGRPVGAIPGSATAWCQMRLVVGTDVNDVPHRVRAHLDAHGFSHVALEVGMRAPATRLDPTSPWVSWAMDAMAQALGQPITLLPNLGGSLPNDIFANDLGLPTLWVPHSYGACGQHAADEHMLKPVAREGLAMMAGLFWALGDTGDTVRQAHLRRAASSAHSASQA